MRCFYYYNDNHYHSDSNSCHQNHIFSTGNRYSNFIVISLSVVKYKLSACQQEYTCEERAIAFEAEVKVEAIVSKQIIVKNNETKGKRRNFNTQVSLL